MCFWARQQLLRIQILRVPNLRSIVFEDALFLSSEINLAMDHTFLYDCCSSLSRFSRGFAGIYQEKILVNACGQTLWQLFSGRLQDAWGGSFFVRDHWLKWKLSPVFKGRLAEEKAGEMLLRQMTMDQNEGTKVRMNVVIFPFQVWISLSLLFCFLWALENINLQEPVFFVVFILGTWDIAHLHWLGVDDFQLKKPTADLRRPWPLAASKGMLGVKGRHPSIFHKDVACNPPKILCIYHTCFYIDPLEKKTPPNTCCT